MSQYDPPPGQPSLRTEYAFTARVALSPTIVIGQGPDGLRRYVPIIGGTVDGPMLQGEVLAAGGDSQVVRGDAVLAVEARYMIRTTDGVNIAVVNRGLRLGPPEVIARLAEGRHVSPTEYYFRTAAQFEAPLGSNYAWLNAAVFVGSAEREADAAIVHFHRVL
jgi:hypothetical protein